MAKEKSFSINLALGLVLGFGGLSGTGKGNTGSGNSGGCCDGTGEECCDAVCDYDSSSGCDSDCGSDGCDSADMVVPQTLWFRRAILTIQIFFLGLFSLAAQGAEKTSQSIQFALYAGPEISIGPLFFTAGACLGQFGCLAVGAGIHYRGFGIGILIPVWLWW